ncbi:hypothetical protein KM043_001787 [Ampulex compressa]|nr:hypothetical protein KM043_001787 [Ampulex compressa]
MADVVGNAPRLALLASSGQSRIGERSARRPRAFKGSRRPEERPSGAPAESSGGASRRNVTGPAYPEPTDPLRQPIFLALRPTFLDFLPRFGAGGGGGDSRSAAGTLSPLEPPPVEVVSWAALDVCRRDRVELAPREGKARVAEGRRAKRAAPGRPEESEPELPRHFGARILALRARRTLRERRRLPGGRRGLAAAIVGTPSCRRYSDSRDLLPPRPYSERATHDTSLGRWRAEPRVDESAATAAYAILEEVQEEGGEEGRRGGREDGETGGAVARGSVEGATRGRKAEAAGRPRFRPGNGTASVEKLTGRNGNLGLENLWFLRFLRIDARAIFHHRVERRPPRANRQAER